MNTVPVMIAVELNLFPFRTEKLKPLAPKILEEISGKIGRRRDIVHNIIFRSVSLNILLTYLCGFSTPWTSPIAFHTMVSSNGRRRDIVHNIIFYKSLVLILSFIYNPFVLKRAERGFHSFKK